MLIHRGTSLELAMLLVITKERVQLIGHKADEIKILKFVRESEVHSQYAPGRNWNLRLLSILPTY